MVVDHRLAPGAAIEIRMHHLPDDGAGADDGDLDDEIVEARRLEPRQRRHLRARLDLKDANGVRGPQHRVDRVVLRQVREVESWQVGLVGMVGLVRAPS